MNINDIENPQFLKDYSTKQCKELSADIREFLLNSVSKTGGHLSSNLGVVELTIALHKVFDCPKDKIIFDVGHQCYIHKILTGRAKQFNTLRQFKGLAGFQKKEESVYDSWEAGHSSTSLSAALGMAVGRDLKNEDYEVIPVIGDGSLTGGMALEALNNIGGCMKQHKVIIIFNDNNMSISKNVGGMNNAFNHLRSSKAYLNLKNDLKDSLERNKLGEFVLRGMINVRDSLKKSIIQDSIFKEYGLDYLGPIDGHNFDELIPALQMAKEHHSSIVVHVMTQKGKGYQPAESDRVGKWHGVGRFNVETGEFLSVLPENMSSWSKIISDYVCLLAAQDERICAITPAMLYGSALEKFNELFPERTFDCGIAEQHAMTFAAGLANSGLRPFISVYSSFLQRAYDQIHHDVARMDLPVVIGIDRAGLVGEDGNTHHGVYDISFLTAIPNMVVCQPKDAYEARCLLKSAFQSNHPVAIRYPRGSAEICNEDGQLIPLGSWQCLSEGNKDYCLVSYGPDIDKINHTVSLNQMNLDVINARFFKPLDEEMLIKMAKQYKKIYVYETDCQIGGLCSLMQQFYLDKEISVNIKDFAIKDHFVEHGSIPELRKQEGIDIPSVLQSIEDEINTH